MEISFNKNGIHINHISICKNKVLYSLLANPRIFGLIPLIDPRSLQLKTGNLTRETVQVDK